MRIDPERTPVTFSEVLRARRRHLDTLPVRDRVHLQDLDHLLGWPPSDPATSGQALLGPSDDWPIEDATHDMGESPPTSMTRPATFDDISDETELVEPNQRLAGAARRRAEILTSAVDAEIVDEHRTLPRRARAGSGSARPVPIRRQSAANPLGYREVSAGRCEWCLTVFAIDDEAMMVAHRDPDGGVQCPGSYADDYTWPL